MINNHAASLTRESPARSARLLLIENDMIRNVEVQAVEFYPYINQKDDSHSKWKHTDCKRYLQVVDLVGGDPILKKHSVQSNQF